MNSLQAIILGAIQGITEFIPVSSSGHLIFFPKLFGWSDQGLAFDVVIHMGTLLAVIVFFRVRIAQLLKSLFSKEKTNKKLLIMLALSIIPAGLAGLLFGDIIEQKFRSPLVVAVGLIFWGIILGLADWYGRKKQDKKTLEDMSWKDMAFMASAQAIALMPGTSRSGITMTAGLFSSLGKTAAAEFSFLMSIPIIGLAGSLKIVELIKGAESMVSVSILSIGFVSSAISGFLAIFFFMKIIQKWSLLPFVLYRIIVGFLIIGYLV